MTWSVGCRNVGLCRPRVTTGFPLCVHSCTSFSQSQWVTDQGLPQPSPFRWCCDFSLPFCHVLVSQGSMDAPMTFLPLPQGASAPSLAPALSSLCDKLFCFLSVPGSPRIIVCVPFNLQFLWLPFSCLTTKHGILLIPKFLMNLASRTLSFGRS